MLVVTNPLRSLADARRSNVSRTWDVVKQVTKVGEQGMGVGTPAIAGGASEAAMPKRPLHMPPAMVPTRLLRTQEYSSLPIVMEPVRHVGVRRADGTLTWTGCGGSDAFFGQSAWAG